MGSIGSIVGIQHCSLQMALQLRFSNIDSCCFIGICGSDFGVDGDRMGLGRGAHCFP